MKKFTSFLMLVAIAMASFTFTSCDDDPWYPSGNGGGVHYPGNNGDRPGNNEVTIADEAAALCGEWYGTMSFKKKTGEGVYEENSFYADMVFSVLSSNATSGVGVETDYVYNEDGSVYDRQVLTFKWTILENFDIRIVYDDGGTYVLDANASQKGFFLGQDDKTQKTVFSGYMIGVEDSDGNEIAFDFEAKSQTGSRATDIGFIAKTFGINVERPAIDMTKQKQLPNRR